MASQDAELQLKVSLDLAFFRQQLTGLGQSAAGYSVPIFIKFDRQTIADEYRLLNRYIGGKDFRIKIQSNLEAEVKRAETLVKTIGELRQTGQGQEGTLPVGISGIASIKPKEARKIRTALRESILSQGGKILVPTSIVAAITQADVAEFKKAVTEKLSGIKVKVGVENGGFAETEQGKAGLMKFMREQGLLGKTASGMTMRMGKDDGDLSQQLGDAVKSAEKIKSIFDGVAKSIATTGKSVANIQGKRLGLGNVPLMARSLEGKGGRSAAAISGVSSSSVLRALYPEVNRTITSLAILRSQVEQNTRKLSGFGLIIGLAAFAGVPLAKSIVKLTGSADNFAELLDSIGIKLQSAFGKAASNILNASSSRLLSGGSLAGLLPAAYRGIGPAAGPAGLLSGRGGPAGLLPPAYRGIGASPNAGALPPAYRGLPSGPIEVQVKELFNPSKLNFLPPGKSGGALEGVLRMMTEDAKAKQAKIDQSIDDLIASIEAASKAMQAIAQSGRVRVVDLGRSTQAALPLGLNAGLLSAGAAQAPAPLPSAVANLSPAQVFPARQRRTRTQADMRGIRSMLPPAQDVTQDGGTEKAIRSFVESIYRQKIKIEKFFAENFSANSQLPQSTRKLAAAMDSAASSLRVLTGTKAFGALPTRDMVDITRFKQAMVAAIRADMDNALRQQMGGRLLPEAGNTGRQAYLRQSMEGMGAFSAPTVGFERIKRTPEQLRQDLLAKREAQARERSALREKDVRSESIQKLLPSAMAIDLGGGKRESLINAFYESLRNTQQILNRYFSANSYLPRATRQLTVAMQQAAQGMKALPGARGPIAALPTKEMVDRTRFQQAIKTAIRTDLDNALKAANSKLYLPAAGQTSYRNPEQIAQQAAQKSPLDIAARTAREQSGQMIRQMRSNMRIPLLPAGRIGETAQSVPAGSERNVSGFKQSIKGLAQQAQDAARAIASQVIPSLKLLQITASSAKGKSSFAWMPQGASNAPRQAQPRTTGPQPPANYSWFHSRAPFVPGPMMGSTGQQWSGAGTQRGVAPPPPPAPPGPLPPLSPPSPPSPPQPPAGGAGGGGGMAAFGRAMGGIQLPGAGLVREIGSEFAMAAKQVLLFGTAYKALAFLTSFPAQVGEAVGALQSFNNTLKAISPTAQEAATSNQFILDIVDRYNTPLQSARDGFTKLYASMAPAGFKGEEIRALFTGVSQAAATFGMSADKVDRVNYAFAQMASKGQVMSEELKGQLGDVLPGAMGIFAEAAGFKGPDAIQKFSKALEDGAYKGQAMRVLLKNVTTVLTKEFGPGAEGAARTFQGVINRMQNSTKLLYEAFEPVAIGFLNSVVVPMTGGLKTITEGFNAFFTGTQTKTAGGFAFARELEKLKPVFEGIRANVVAVLPTLQSFGGVLLEVSKVFLQIAGNPFVGYLARVYLNVLALTTVINILNLRALIPFIANLARSAFALVAFSAQMVGANQGLQLLNLTTRTAGATLRTFFATTGVGLVLVGIGLLIERFMSMNQKLEETRQKALGAADAIRNMSRTEARQSENQAAMDVKTLQRLQSRRNEGKTDIAITKEEEKALERTGTRIGRSVLGMRAVPGSAPEVMGYGEKVVDVSQVQAAILKRQGDLGTASRRIRDLQFQEQQSQAPTNLAPIPPGGGDASAAQKAAEKAQKAAEKLASQNQQLSIDAANRQNALNKTIFDSSIALSDQEYQHGIDLIDARNQYELSGLNSIAARQEKFQQDLQKIELQRIEIVRKAEQESAKASIEYRAAQNVATAAGSSGSDGTGKAIFGDTGRTFNAPGWVHGHFQNMDREALVKDTVEVVMGLLQQGSAAELSSGAPFKQGMSQSQVERLVRQGIGSHKQYASGASAIDVFVPKGTKVPTPLSGVGNLGGNAGVAGNLPRGSQLMHLDPRSASGGTMQRRKAKAGGKLEVETQQVSSQQEQSRQAIIFATNKALEDRVTLIKSNLDTLFPVAEQKLENDLMIKRNQLQLQGMPQEYIDYQESAYKGAYEVNEAIKRYSESTVDLEKKKAALEARQAKGVALTTAETEALRNYTESIAQNDKAVADLEPKQRTMNILMLEGAIATMKNADALKAQQETMDLIKGSVESASNSYKGFLKEVATGGDPTEALQKFQEGLTDQVLTIFFDYAFKPVEDFFKDSLSNLFNVPTEDEQRKKGQAALEAQLAHVKSIDTKVSAIANQTPQAGAATTTAAPTMGGQATLTSLSSSAMAFGGAGGEAISSALASTFESAQASIGLSMESLASSFEYGKDKLLEGVPPFEQALTVDLPGQVEKSTEALKAKGSTFSESLGKLTQGVGIAVGSIMGIAAGISQVKKGGTGNTLMGIGSVLASVGGAIGGFSKLSKAANGAVWTGGFQAFANGGTVKGPTLGLVGEGKYNEAIVPLPDGRSIPVQMRGGPGGGSSRDLLAAQSQSRSSPSVLSMSFQSTTINGVEYVDRAQLEMAMAETRRVASRDGAARGANLAIDRLANSPSSRRRAGIR